MNTNGTTRGIDEALALSLADLMRDLRKEMQEEVKRAVTNVPRVMEINPSHHAYQVDTMPIAKEIAESLAGHHSDIDAVIGKLAKLADLRINAELQVDEDKLASTIVAGLTPIFANLAEQLAQHSESHAKEMAEHRKELAALVKAIAKRPKRKLKGKDADGEFEIEEM